MPKWYGLQGLIIIIRTKLLQFSPIHGFHPFMERSAPSSVWWVDAPALCCLEVWADCIYFWLLHFGTPPGWGANDRLTGQNITCHAAVAMCRVLAGVAHSWLSEHCMSQCVCHAVYD
jgi:hypothetical protein